MLRGCQSVPPAVRKARGSSVWALILSPAAAEASFRPQRLNGPHDIRPPRGENFLHSVKAPASPAPAELRAALTRRPRPAAYVSRSALSPQK